MNRQFKPAVLAGLFAGLVMALAMMGYMKATGHSVWTNPNLIAAMWLGNAAADGRLSLATAVGFATHMVTSAIMGVVAVPFIASLPPLRTLLAAVSYAIASYPVVFAAVISWANPLMVARTELVPMTAAHALFGLVRHYVHSPASPEGLTLNSLLSGVAAQSGLCRCSFKITAAHAAWRTSEKRWTSFGVS